MTEQLELTIEPKKVPAHYVDNKKFFDALVEYKKQVDHAKANELDKPRVSEYLGECFLKIATHLSYKANFINYSYKDEMVGDAIVKMFSALRNKKFKIDSGFSPFSYFTTIAFHAFINRIKKEKKHHEVINEYKEKVYNDLMLDANESGNGYIYVEPTGDDDNDE